MENVFFDRDDTCRGNYIDLFDKKNNLFIRRYYGEVTSDDLLLATIPFILNQTHKVLIDFSYATVCFSYNSMLEINRIVSNNLKVLRNYVIAFVCDSPAVALPTFIAYKNPNKLNIMVFTSYHTAIKWALSL